MLSAIMGGLLNVINVLKGIIFANKERFKAEHPAYLMVFTALAIASYVLTFTVFGKAIGARNIIVELLPVIGVVLSNLSFGKKDAKSVRFFNLATSPCWLIYNIVSFSIGGIISEIFCFTSTVVGIIRLDIRKKPLPDENTTEETVENTVEADEKNEEA